MEGTGQSARWCRMPSSASLLARLRSGPRSWRPKSSSNCACGTKPARFRSPVERRRDEHCRLHGVLPGPARQRVRRVHGQDVGHFDRPVVADGGRVPTRVADRLVRANRVAREHDHGMVALDPALVAHRTSLRARECVDQVRPPVWLIVGGTLEATNVKNGGATMFAPYRAWFRLCLTPTRRTSTYERRQDVDAGWPRRRDVVCSAGRRCSASAFGAQMLRYSRADPGRQRPLDGQRSRRANGGEHCAARCVE